MKDKKILYGIIIAFAFMLSIGLTYAYFSVTTSVVGDRNDIKASVGTLSILYTDGSEIVAESIQPGWTTTKTISIENTGSLDTNYSIEWAKLTNEIENNELVMSATCSQTKGGSVSGTCSAITEAPVATSTGSIVHNINIESGYKHTYTITFEFKEISSVQNYNQGKAFNGEINILGETYTLAGVLYDSNGNPIEGATVEMHSNPKYSVTDVNGEFEIIGLESGNHTVTVTSSADVVLATDSITVSDGNITSASGKNITVKSSLNAVNVSVTLSESSISEIHILSWYDKCKLSSTDLKCKILSDNTAYADNVASTYVSSSSGIDFSAFSSDTNGKGLYYTVDSTKTEDGERVYYYRGAVTNNYLLMGGYCWRVIRTVEDGSIRILYEGIPTDGTCPQTETYAEIMTAPFNKSYYDNAFVGYMYGTPNSTTYEATHANVNSSNIKKIVDAWYTGGTTSGQECYGGTDYNANTYVNCDFTQISSKLVNYASLIADTPYCNDRSIGNGGNFYTNVFTELGYGKNNTIYAAGRRLSTNGNSGTESGPANSNPTYVCAQNNDKFTVSSSVGNGDLTYPIALLTADEGSFAGLIYSTTGSSSYLNTAFSILMTPSRYGFYDGYMSQPTTFARTNWGISDYLVNRINMGVVPAISLKSNVVVSSGEGTYSDPYIIQ